MTVTIPTVDDFADTTVMRVIRKIVDYIRTDLVPSINDNDIERVDCTLSGQTLTFRLYKGDNTTITDTVSLSTFVTSTELANELNGYATEDALSDLQEQITAISPQLSIHGNVLTVTVNGDSSSVTLPTGEANPYPTSVDLSVSGNNLSINIPMSEGNALRDTVALPQSGSTEFNPDDYYISMIGTPSGTNQRIETEIIDKPANFNYAYIDLISLDNEIHLNTGMQVNNVNYTTGDVVADIVKTVSGSVSDGKLTITVNGVSSGDIPLPVVEPDWNTILDISGSVVINSSSGLTHDEYDGSVTNEISSSGNPNPASSLIRYKNYILDLGGDAFIDSIYIKKDGGRQYLMNGDISLFPVISDKIQALKETIGDFKYAVCINTSGRGFADYMELTLPRYYNTADYIGDTATNTPPSGFAIDTTDVRTGTFPFCVVPLLEPPE